MSNGWFAGLIKMLFWCKVVVSSWFLAMLSASGTGVLIRVTKKAVYALCTCAFAFGGAAVGTIVGAIKGQTTETGLLHGAGIGAVAGAITAVQLLESAADGESLSKVALLMTSLMNGKVFMEWVSPAMLKAYQWQINTMEATYREISDVYDTTRVKGLSEDAIQKLPNYTIDSKQMVQLCQWELCCSICLQDFMDGDSARKLPKCGHCFHLDCLDKWLARNGSCPVCRENVCEDPDTL